MEVKNQFTSNSTSGTGTSEKVHIQTIPADNVPVITKQATEWMLVKALLDFGHLPMANDAKREVITTVADYMESGTAPQMFQDVTARRYFHELLKEDKGLRNEAIMANNIKRLSGEAIMQKLLQFDLMVKPDILQKWCEDDPLPAYERFALSAMDFYMTKVFRAFLENSHATLDEENRADIIETEREMLQSIEANNIIPLYSFTVLIEFLNL